MLYIIFGVLFLFGVAAYWWVTRMFTRERDTYEQLPADHAR